MEWGLEVRVESVEDGFTGSLDCKVEHEGLLDRNVEDAGAIDRKVEDKETLDRKVVDSGSPEWKDKVLGLLKRDAFEELHLQAARLKSS